eukprot:7303442-Alexandrium_andersonii.AAC.1
MPLLGAMFMYAFAHTCNACSEIRSSDSSLFSMCLNTPCATVLCLELWTCLISLPMLCQEAGPYMNVATRGTK